MLCLGVMQGSIKKALVVALLGCLTMCQEPATAKTKHESNRKKHESHATANGQCGIFKVDTCHR